MLKGINILNQTEITETPNWCFTVFIVTIIIIFLAVLLYGIIREHDFVGGFFLGGAFGLLVGIIVFITLDVFVPDISTGEYEYQVTIEKSVDFKEFDDTYTVLNQEGEIYTIIEK